MNNYQTLYWITRLDAARSLLEGFILFGVLTLIAFILMAFFAHMDDYEDNRRSGKWLSRIKYPVIAIFLSATLKAFVPTQNEAILIAAGGSTLNYVQSDSSLNKIPYQATKVISEMLDDKIKELQKEKK